MNANSEQRIKYLGLDMTIRGYKRLQIGIIGMWLLGALLLYIFFRDHSNIYLRVAPYVCIFIAIAETVETMLALKKKRFNK